MMRLRLLSLSVAGLSWLILNPVARAENNMMPNHFTESYVYTNDDLGAVYHPEATSVKLWAPTAKQVRLLLFNDATNESFQAIPLSRDPNGIWSADLAGDMDGRYYLYEVTFLPAGIRETDGLSCQRSLCPRLFRQFRPDVDL